LLELFIPLIIILILRVVVRRTWIAVLLLWLMFIVMVIPETGNATLTVPVVALGFAIWCFFLVRFGLLTLAVGVTLSNMLNELPLTLNLTAWWSGTTWLVLALFAGITAWGFWAALAAGLFSRTRSWEPERDPAELSTDERLPALDAVVARLPGPGHVRHVRVAGPELPSHDRHRRQAQLRGDGPPGGRVHPLRAGACCL